MLNDAINFSLDVQEYVQQYMNIDRTKLLEFINRYGGNVASNGSIRFNDGSSATWSEKDSAWDIK